MEVDGNLWKLMESGGSWNGNISKSMEVGGSRWKKTS